MFFESSADVVKELAGHIRDAMAGGAVNLSEAELAIDRVLFSSTKTERDVLAVIVMARHVVNSIEGMGSDIDRGCLELVQRLQEKAIAALEVIARERAATFQGYERQ